MGLYPVSLKIDGRLCVIIGGGRVAVRKAASLLECGAVVKVVAPALSPEFEPFHHRIDHVARPYHWVDLEGAFLVIAATNDDETNRAVEEEAHGRHVLLNVVDKPDQCNFYVPAAIRRGDLLLTVSTGGALPALAKRLRRQLEDEFPEEWAEVVRLLGEARREVIQRVSEESNKTECLAELARLDLVPLITSSGVAAAQAEIERCISRYLA